jgi:hypothetical protein
MVLLMGGLWKVEGAPYIQESPVKHCHITDSSMTNDADVWPIAE